MRLGHGPTRHAAHVSYPIQALNDDPQEIYRALQDAKVMRDYVLHRVGEGLGVRVRAGNRARPISGAAGSRGAGSARTAEALPPARWKGRAADQSGPEDSTLHGCSLRWAGR